MFRPRPVFPARLSAAAFGAAIFAMALSAAARADEPGFVDCASKPFVSGANLDPGFQCVETARETISLGGRTVGVRALYDARSGDVLTSYGALAVQAIKRSLETYAGFEYGWEFANVTVVLLDPRMDDGGLPPRENFKNVHADANGHVFPSDCIVRLSSQKIEAMNAAGDKGALDHAEVVLAHEAFHCVQAWNYRRQMIPPASEWWVEGTATFFATLVYEGKAELALWTQRFVDTIATKPLTQQSYASVYFFAWLWGKEPTDILKLMAAMPQSGGETEQQAALRDLLRDRTGEFARDMVDGKVKDAMGHPLPAPKPESVITFESTQNVDLGIFPFMLFYRELAFVDGLYMFSADQPNDLSYIEIGGGKPWEQPASFWSEGGCGKTKRFRLVGMSEQAALQKIRFTAERVTGECATCAVVQERDECLKGEWRITNASIAETVMSITGQGLDETQISGGAAMTFRADGVQLTGFNMLTVEGKPSAGEAGRFRVYIAGIIESDWGAAQGNLSMCYRKSDAAIQTAVRGEITDPIMFDELVSLSGNRAQSYSYECSGDRLILDGYADTAKIRLELERYHGGP